MVGAGPARDGDTTGVLGNVEVDGGSRLQLPSLRHKLSMGLGALQLLTQNLLLLPSGVRCHLCQVAVRGFRCSPTPLTPAFPCPLVQVLADQLRDACQRAGAVPGGGEGPGAPPPCAAGRGARQPVHVGTVTWGVWGEGEWMGSRPAGGPGA